MIWRVRDRRTFEAFRARGLRATNGAVTLVHLAPDVGGAGEPTRVAFAAGRKVGGAVERNRVRRRLRQVMRELAAAGSLPPGALLVVARPEVREMEFQELKAQVTGAVERIVSKLDQR